MAWNGQVYKQNKTKTGKKEKISDHLYGCSRHLKGPGISDTSVSQRLQSSRGIWKKSRRLASSPQSTYWMISPSSSKLGGTNTPASFKAWFLATAVSEAWLAHAPAWPNCTWKAKGRGFTGLVKSWQERTKKAPGNVGTHCRPDPARCSM